MLKVSQFLLAVSLILSTSYATCEDNPLAPYLDFDRHNVNCANMQVNTTLVQTLEPQGFYMPGLSFEWLIDIANLNDAEGSFL